MAAPHSDALVWFGITGDLGYKQTFSALASMIRRGHLNVPIVVGALIAGRILLPTSRDPEESKLDPPGALLSLPQVVLAPESATKYPNAERVSGLNGRWEGEPVSISVWQNRDEVTKEEAVA